MLLLLSSLIILLSAGHCAVQTPSKHPKACTITSPNSGLTFDLNSIAVYQPNDSHAEKVHSWHARGYDYGYNFTLNFCAPVVEPLADVVGVDERHWASVSAFYTHKGNVYSIGQMSTAPVFRGRKLTLNYTDGSPCNEPSSSRSQSLPHVGEDGDKKDDGKKDDADTPKAPKKPPAHGKTPVRRKSTLISFFCERDPQQPKVSVSFPGASPDECFYMFEVRTSAACGSSNNNEKETVGPWGIFGFIALIALAVYILGGVAYQRTVLHQRGWRQLPNYTMWAGMASFAKDIFIILTSSCARLLPSRRGYNRLPTSNAPRGRTSTRNEDENRLIDSLDDEWDD